MPGALTTTCVHAALRSRSTAAASFRRAAPSGSWLTAPLRPTRRRRRRARLRLRLSPARRDPPLDHVARHPEQPVDRPYPVRQMGVLATQTRVLVLQFLLP